MVTSDLRPEVEMWPFRALAIKKICKPLGPYYRNSSDIVNLAIGQIPRSTERISIISASLLIPCLKGVLNCCF